MVGMWWISIVLIFSRINKLAYYLEYLLLQGSLFIPKIEFFINADIAGWNFYKVVMGNFFIKMG